MFVRQCRLEQHSITPGWRALACVSKPGLALQHLEGRSKGDRTLLEACKHAACAELSLQLVEWQQLVKALLGDELTLRLEVFGGRAV